MKLVLCLLYLFGFQVIYVSAPLASFFKFFVGGKDEKPLKYHEHELTMKTCRRLHYCREKQDKCLKKCQNIQADGISFCSVLGDIYATYTEGVADTFFDSSSDLFIVDYKFWIIKSIEGMFLAISEICNSGEDVVKIRCEECQPGEDFENILQYQNITEKYLTEYQQKVIEQIKEIDQNLDDINSKFMDESEVLPESSRRKILQYDDILAETDMILYWFSQKHLSALFYKLFEDKVSGIHGGIEWIIWGPIIYFFDGRSPSRHQQSFFI